MNKMIPILAVVLCLAVPAVARAQDPDDDEQFDAALDERRDKVLEKMQAVRAWKLAEVLELNDKI